MLLGVRPGATLLEIRSAFRAHVRRGDTNKGGAEAERFVLIRTAFRNMIRLAESSGPRLLGTVKFGRIDVQSFCDGSITGRCAGRAITFDDAAGDKALSRYRELAFSTDYRGYTVSRVSAATARNGFVADYVQRGEPLVVEKGLTGRGDGWDVEELAHYSDQADSVSRDSLKRLGLGDYWPKAPSFIPDGLPSIPKDCRPPAVDNISWARQGTHDPLILQGAWSAQLTGERVVFLYPPCDIEAVLDNRPGAPCRVHLGPGDVVIIPPFWGCHESSNVFEGEVLSVTTSFLPSFLLPIARTIVLGNKFGVHGAK
jgi:hypothetical protein